MTGSARERGFALLIVLWTVGLMALLLTRVVASGRAEVQLAGNLRVAAMDEATADGAVHDAVFHLLAGAWPVDGRARRVRIGEEEAEVRVENLAGRLNPNETPLEVMRRLLVDIGADPARAAALAAAMEDWRTEGDDPLPLGAKAPQYRAAGLPYVPTGKPFRDLQEIGLVFGMSPDLLAALGPHLSVFQEGETNVRLADPLVARAIAAGDGATARATPDDDPGRPLVVEIAAATLRHGRPVFTRRAVVRFAAVSRSNPTPWRVLSWDGVAE